MELNNNTPKKRKVKVNNIKIKENNLTECPYCKSSGKKLMVLDWFEKGTQVGCDNCGVVFNIVTPKTLKIETITEPQKFLM